MISYKIISKNGELDIYVVAFLKNWCQFSVFKHQFFDRFLWRYAACPWALSQAHDQYQHHLSGWKPRWMFKKDDFLVILGTFQLYNHCRRWWNFSGRRPKKVCFLSIRIEVSHAWSTVETAGTSTLRGSGFGPMEWGNFLLSIRTFMQARFT